MGRLTPQPATIGPRRAFTLVELLVVIGIIALLMGILMPALSRARETARRTACASNLRQLALAVHMYASDFQNRLPFANSETLETNGQWNGGGWLYKHPNNSQPEHVEEGALWPILKNRAVYRCPSDDPPWDSGPTQNLSSYMMNGAVNGYAKIVPALKLSRFKGDAIMFMEPDPKNTGGSGSWNDGNNNADNSLTDRHHKGGSVARFDGGVEYMTCAEYREEGKRKPGRLWCNPDTDTGE